MTNKIYEYIDENNWYIGEWTRFRKAGYHFNDIPYRLLEHIDAELSELIEQDLDEEYNAFTTVVVKYGSPMSYIQFVLNMINDRQERDFKATSHKGAILITEKDLLRKVFFLSKDGVKMTDFFGQGQESEMTVGDTILIATRNEGKTAEFRKLFEKLGYKVENLKDYPDLPEVEETGTTFEENARLKAETISKLTGKMVLADDSGLQVDVLGGLPGVWSARFAGVGATDDENNIKLLHELAMVFEIKDRSANFHTTLVVASPDRESLVVEADWPGYIAHEPKGENGFGYDPYFYVPEFKKTMAELSIEEKERISHRGRALRELINKL